VKDVWPIGSRWRQFNWPRLETSVEARCCWYVGSFQWTSDDRSVPDSNIFSSTRICKPIKQRIMRGF